MKAAWAGLSGLFLSVCVLFGTWAPLYWQLGAPRWAELAIAAAVGLAAGALASRETPVWLAWIVLVVLAWAAYVWAAFNMIPTPMVPQFAALPLSASVGVIAGLIAWRMPLRPVFWRFVPIVLCAAAVTGIVFLKGPLTALGQPAKWAPQSFTLQLASGEQITSQSLAGNTVVLSFWATWCGPCREELPALQHLYRAHYADREDVRFFLINEDHGPGAAGKAQAWLQQHDITMPSALDASGALGQQLKISSVLPARVVIGPLGKVLLTTWGYSKEDAGFPELRAAIATGTDRG